MSFSVRKYFELLNSYKFKEASEYRATFVPDYIYKFFWLHEIRDSIADQALVRANELRFSTLQNNALWFALPSSQNDPYEFKGMYIDREQLLESGFTDDILDKALRKMYAEVPLCCFVANYNTNMPMWAHYANNHRGYCVKYKVLKKQGLFNVVYEPKRIPITKIFASFFVKGQEILRGSDEAKMEHFMYLNLLKENYFIKHVSWQYEQEFRMIYPTDEPISGGLNVPLKK